MGEQFTNRGLQGYKDFEALRGEQGSTEVDSAAGSGFSHHHLKVRWLLKPGDPSEYVSKGSKYLQRMPLRMIMWRSGKSVGIAVRRNYQEG